MNFSFKILGAWPIVTVPHLYIIPTDLLNFYEVFLRYYELTSQEYSPTHPMHIQFLRR